ncbi:MAG TPA: kynureninase [Bacteroidales bacterium]|nr:kynureninase [Bacteroidales bacterium]
MENIYKLEYAKKMDEQDPLRRFRWRFVMNDTNLIYLDGNSLGMLSFDTVNDVDDLIKEEWGNRLIRGWNESWFQKSENIGAKVAKLIGAHSSEVIMADSTSVNLFKLAYGALKLNSDRNKIITDTLNFPSDLYLLQGLVSQFGDRHKLVRVDTKNSISVEYEDIAGQIDNQTALVCLSHVVFKSAFMYDMKRITSLAHEKGALVLWDLSHSVGAIPVNLNDCGVDLAVGCTYKYLNGGPGAPAFLYVREDLQEKIESPVWGWFGDEKPFNFSLDYIPAKGIRKFLSGTPPVLSLAAVEPAIDIMLEAGIENIRNKNIAQTDYLLTLVRKWLLPLEFKVGSPESADQRGSHITLKHPEAYRIAMALIDPECGDRVVIPDFREPDNIRLGIAALYNNYEEIYRAINQIRNITENRLFENYSHERNMVT